MRSLTLCSTSPFLQLPPIEPVLHDCDINCTLCIFINITVLLQNVCFVCFCVFLCMSPQLFSCLLACLALMAFCVTVDSDDPVMLAVSTISMSLQVRHATSFWREALRAKKNSWDTPASIEPSTGPIQYTCRSRECERERERL